MILVCDVNEIWRRRPFAALTAIADVVGVLPADGRVIRKRGFKTHDDGLPELKVQLPPGWASRMAWLGQRILWKKMTSYADSVHKEIDAVVVTSPHYLPLLKIIPPRVPTFYYASDDYRNYDGWQNVSQKEEALIRSVDHSFFVSEGLMHRARDEYGIDSNKLSVSMNATEGRFFPTSGTLPSVPPVGELKRPIAGVMGGINDRLNFELLTQCADLDELGTLLLVGNVPAEPSDRLQTLLEHEKCIAVGAQKHEEMHQWFQCLDVGLIPYRKSDFNRFCSPMRLFDHLASGAPIVATNACEQVSRFEQQVDICGTNDAFVQTLSRKLIPPDERSGPLSGITWKDRAERLLKIIREESCA